MPNKKKQREESGLEARMHMLGTGEARPATPEELAQIAKQIKEREEFFAKKKMEQS